MEKAYSWPDGHWDWPIKLPYKHGVKCGNMIKIRASYFKEPGPAATGIPVPFLAYEGMMTEIEVIAMVD